MNIVASILSWVLVIALVGFVVFQTTGMVKQLISKRRSKTAGTENKETEEKDDGSSEHVDGTSDRNH